MKRIDPFWLPQKLTVLSILFHLVCVSGNCQPFISDPGIPDPVITFVNDSVVRMHYDSIYHVHQWWDTLQYPHTAGNIRHGILGRFDNVRIFEDLMTALDVREYQFITLYTDDDLRYGEAPGWINVGFRNKRLAKNIGQDNNLVDNSPYDPGWGKIVSMPHMNNVEFLDRPQPGLPNYGSTLTLFHEIGHIWGVNWLAAPATQLGWSPIDWEPWMPPIVLVNGGGHWWPPHSNRWVDPHDAGILPSAPSSNQFNLFDLYAMGISPYSDVKDSATYVRDPGTSIEYPVTVDSLIDVLGAYQNYLDTTDPDEIPDWLESRVYMTGDGKRIPAIDYQMFDLKTLIVVITGEESIFTANDEDLLMQLARDTPPDWHIATRNLSEMSTKIEHKMVNDLTRILNGDSASITLLHFLSGYNDYMQSSMDSIRIENLPTKGTLFYFGEEVTAGEVIPPGNIIYDYLVYKRDPLAIGSDEFSWNAKTNGRWAVPAKVKFKNLFISPNLKEKVAPADTEEGIAFYPNPTADRLNILLPPNEKISKAIVLDWAGRPVMEANMATFDISQLPGGTYIVKVFTSAGPYAGKIVVSR